MKKVFEDKRRFTVGKEDEIPFSLPEKGLYLIEVSARARNARLISKDATDDEDLTLEIDGRSFPHLTVKGRKIDSPASFSGGTQKGKRKTVYFLINLERGKHELKLTSDNQPRFEGFEVFLLEGRTHIGLPLKTQAEDGDRRSWLAFVLVELPLRDFSAEVTVWKRSGDSDDVKVKINGELKPFPEPLPRENFLWKLFHWVGSVFLGDSKISFFNTSLPKGLHYIEFIADRKPRLEKIEFSLREPEAFAELVKPYTYKGVKGDEDYNRFDGTIQKVVEKLNNEFLSQKFPPPEPLDPNVVKAMIYIESRMGYFKTKENQYPAYPDVMQVADPRNPALKTLQGELIEYEWFESEVIPLRKLLKENPKVEPLEDSIYWGVRWLYHKAQIITRDKKKRIWKDWAEAVADYNSNDNWEYQKKVWRIYKEGVAPGGIKLRSLLILFLVGVLLHGLSWFYLNQGQVYVSTSPYTYENLKEYELFVKRLDGFRMKRLAVPMNADSTGTHWHLDRESEENPVLVNVIETEGGDYLMIEGNSVGEGQRAALVVEDYEGVLRTVPFVDDYGWVYTVVDADRILVEKLGELVKVVAQSYIPLSDNPYLLEEFYLLAEDRSNFEYHGSLKKSLSSYPW